MDLIKITQDETTNELEEKTQSITEIFDENTRKYKKVIIDDLTGEIIKEIPEFIFAKYDKWGNFKGWRIDCGKLDKFVRENNNYFFVPDKLSGKNLTYWYENGVYSLVGENEVKSTIKDYIANFDISLLNISEINNVYKLLIADKKKFKNQEELNTDENIINFQNGILHLDTMELTKHSPDTLSTIQIPCKWSGKPLQTPVYDEYMNTLTSGNYDKQQLIEEFAGVAVSNVYGFRMKKALFLIGKGNSGKSQMQELLFKLLQGDNICKISIQQLEESRFILSNVMNKRLVGSSDLSFETAKSMENFKMLTGGDNMKVEVKNGGIYNAKFGGVIIMSGNPPLPRFGGDKGKHVYERMAIINCDNVIPENERDPLLLDKLYSEREGIIYKLITAVKRVIENGYNYDIPTECEANIEVYKIFNSSILQFYTECCCERPEKNPYADKITTARLYDVFKEWCKKSGIKNVPSKQSFRKELSEYFNADIQTLERVVDGFHYYTFTVTDEIHEHYHYVVPYCAT